MDSKFAQSDLIGRYSPDGNFHIDWYGTTVSGRGVGVDMISKAVESVWADKVKAVSAQLGNVNCDSYNSAISSGISPVQAVWATPLGETMISLGFKGVEVNAYNVKLYQ